MGEFIVKAIDAFGLTSVHTVGLDVGSPSVLFAALVRPELFRKPHRGCRRPRCTHSMLTAPSSGMIEAEPLPPLNAVEVIAAS